jgi:hypothetical protein
MMTPILPGCCIVTCSLSKVQIFRLLVHNGQASARKSCTSFPRSAWECISNLYMGYFMLPENSYLKIKSGLTGYILQVQYNLE